MNFEEFMINAVPDEMQRIQLQEFAGACIDKQKKFCNKFLFVIDDGSSTCSYFLNELSKIALTSNVNIDDSMKYDWQLEPLLCKSVNISYMHKLPKKLYLVDRIKKIVCGEPIQLDLARRTPFVTNEFPKLIFMTYNNIIKLEENLHRRAIIVYFSGIDHVRFNLDFSSVHVLEWCKAGLRRLRKNKYAFTNNGGACNA